MDVNGKLVHTATWWATSPDGFGGDTFVAPVKIKCRWEDRYELIAGVGATKELVSQAIVYVDRDISEGDYLCRDDQTTQSDPTTVVGAYKVQHYGVVTDLRNVQSLRRAML
jgi:hypothetical protein